ncbi:hypothetical protein B0H12DRAFT_1321561 [Mycena haematopus]|nr:hypothetical protein B0H12DRAFT_1321561 [Mycena haematopus]
MADTLILNNLRTAYNILFRNVTRTLQLHVDEPERIPRQIAEVAHFFVDAQQYQALFPEAEFELLKTYITKMVECLCKARPVPDDATSSTADPEIPPSEMHRCLHVPELVWMIVSQLDPHCLEGRAALAALARCRIFHGPALDALWREQETIRNLLNCMPEDLWVDEPVHRIRTMRLRRPIRAEDWSRVLQYSHRVRSFRFHNFGRPALSEVFNVLRLNVPGDYLLPNLETLYWSPSHDIQFSNIDLFLGPRLTSITLSQLTLAQLSLLPTLTRRFPNLSEVAFDSMHIRLNERPQFNGEISVFIRGLRSVRTLRLTTPINIEAIAHIGRLPTLETLHLVAPAGPPSRISLPQRALFHRLRSVHFQCAHDATIEFAVSVVQSWANPPLHSFVMKHTKGMTADATEKLFCAISEHCAHDSLEILAINLFWPTAREESPDYIIPGRAVKLLFCFSHLTTVSIESPHGMQFDDESIAELAAAWPQIEELCLGGLTNIDPIPQCGTLLALHAFARHCPNLHTLELTLDATSIPAVHPDALRRQQLIHPELLKLNVAYSLISKAFDVARFISATFINLTEVVTALEDDYFGDNPEEEEDLVYSAQVVRHKVWKEVEAFLPALHDIRSEEFHWGEQSIEQTGYLLPFDFNDPIDVNSLQ